MITIELPLPPSANRYGLVNTPEMWYNGDTSKYKLSLRCSQHPGTWIPRKRLDTMIDRITVFARCKYEESPVLIPESHGIYVIFNHANNNFYVGSTVNLRQRWRQHIWSLDNGSHHNPHLQSAWKKYGANSFEFLVVEIIAKQSDILPREQEWLDEFYAPNKHICYNFCERAYSHLGRKRSEETKRRLSDAQKGKKASDQAKQKMRAAKVGKKLTEEHKRKVGEKSKGRPGPRHAPEIKQKYRKLTKEQAIEVKSMRLLGIELKPIAERFGVGVSTICRIIKGESYAGVENE